MRNGRSLRDSFVYVEQKPDRATEAPDICIFQPLWQDDNCLLENGNHPMKYSSTWRSNTAGTHVRYGALIKPPRRSRVFTQAVKPLPGSLLPVPLELYTCAGLD